MARVPASSPPLFPPLIPCGQCGQLGGSSVCGICNGSVCDRCMLSTRLNVYCAACVPFPLELDLYEFIQYRLQQDCLIQCFVGRSCFVVRDVRLCDGMVQVEVKRWGRAPRWMVPDRIEARWADVSLSVYMGELSTGQRKSGALFGSFVDPSPEELEELRAQGKRDGWCTRERMERLGRTDPLELLAAVERHYAEDQQRHDFLHPADALRQKTMMDALLESARESLQALAEQGERDGTL